jgi:ERCC4-type nuclease
LGQYRDACRGRVDGVSIETARPLLEQFETLLAVGQTTRDDLRGVTRIGAKKAEAIFSLFHEQQSLTRSN